MKRITRFDEYQKIAMSTLYSPFKDKGKQLEYGILALCGEAGELANVVKHVVYYKDTSYTAANIVDELSDVLWYVACIADSLNIKLSEIATFNVDKVLAKKNSKKKGEDHEVLG